MCLSSRVESVLNVVGQMTASLLQNIRGEEGYEISSARSLRAIGLSVLREATVLPILQCQKISSALKITFNFCNFKEHFMADES